MKKILICILFLVILTIGCNKPDKNNEPVTPYEWDVYLVNGEIWKAIYIYPDDVWLKLYTDSGNVIYPSSQVLKIEKIKQK